MSPERQTPVPIEEEMRRSYLDYAMSVIVGRALPDVRDGLKPVHRRVLFAMQELGLVFNRPYKKSARVVGEVLGKYHPHGDAPVYEALVRMVQEFSLRYPLVDGQGNFGSIDGDPPAAMRYTEARLARIAHELLADIDKETVDFVPNFDESLAEPTVLPTRVPNLLVNGSSGIAVGMATNIPPHNLGEVVAGLVALIDRPDIAPEELMKLIPGPDFPTAGYIYGRAGIREAYTTGRGTITLRAKAHVEKLRGGREAIIVTELPYQVNKATLIEKIGELIRDRKIEGISERRDESSREGIRIVLELSRGELPQIVINQLYRHTQMQTTFGVIMLALVGRRPQVVTLKQMLQEFVQFRREVVTRRTRYDLARAEEKAHILEGLRKAVDQLDLVIRLIRQAESPDAAREALMTRLAAHRGPGARDPGHAAAAADPARAEQDRRGPRRDAAPDRRPQGHPRLRGTAPRHHQGRARDPEGRVRGRPAHRDPDRDRRPDHRGPPGRRGHGGHHHALRATSSARTSKPTGARSAAARA